MQGMWRFWHGFTRPLLGREGIPRTGFNILKTRKNSQNGVCLETIRDFFFRLKCIHLRWHLEGVCFSFFSSATSPSCKNSLWAGLPPPGCLFPSQRGHLALLWEVQPGQGASAVGKKGTKCCAVPKAELRVPSSRAFITG